MSKANQAFKQNDEAVSPVIGVILMVAITVVLAAVVFVLVSNLGGDSNTAPAISWNKNESQDTLSVVTASSNADWTNLEISFDVAASGYCLEGTIADGTTACTAAFEEIATAGSALAIRENSEAVRAGDEFEFCSGTASSTAPVALTVTITDPSANQIVKTETFSITTACP